jgi:cytosine/adenosine deaminase-related metal-dependent hydrolase
VGQLSPGKAADVVAFDLHQLSYAGATHNPLDALVFCAPQTVSLSLIDGKIVVEDGELRTLDLGPHIERHNAISRRLIRGE